MINSEQHVVNRKQIRKTHEKHFKNKLSDADSENSKTQLWLDFALACNYISEDKKQGLQHKSEEIGKLINYMMKNPNKFGVINTSNLATVSHYNTAYCILKAALLLTKD